MKKSKGTHRVYSNVTSADYRRLEVHLSAIAYLIAVFVEAHRPGSGAGRIFNGK